MNTEQLMDLYDKTEWRKGPYAHFKTVNDIEITISLKFKITVELIDKRGTLFFEYNYPRFVTHRTIVKRARKLFEAFIKLERIECSDFTKTKWENIGNIETKTVCGIKVDVYPCFAVSCSTDRLFIEFDYLHDMTKKTLRRKAKELFEICMHLKTNYRESKY